MGTVDGRRRAERDDLIPMSKDSFLSCCASTHELSDVFLSFRADILDPCIDNERATLISRTGIGSGPNLLC